MSLRSRFILIALFLLVAVALPRSAEATVARAIHFHDTFVGESSHGWGFIGAGWDQTGGLMTRTGSGGALAAAGGSDWRDVDYSVRVRGQGTGAVVRYANSSNYMRVQLSVNGVLLTRKINGAFRSTRYTPVKQTAGVIHIRAIGSWFRVFVDDRQVFLTQESRLPSGRVGLYTDGNGRFDSVSADATVDWFNVAVIPDTQNEVRSAGAPKLNSQMAWILSHRGSSHIAAVLQEGDVVNSVWDNTQWTRATANFSLLRGQLPFFPCAGNHDIQDYDHEDYPWPEHDGAYEAFVRDVGAPMSMNGVNGYGFFDAAGTSFGVLSGQFGMRDSALAWGRSVVASHPHQRWFLNTHDLLGETNQWRTAANQNAASHYDPTMNNGIDIRNKLIGQVPIEFTVNGHVITGTAGRRDEATPFGRVYAAMFNRQNDSGGDGWLRTMTFRPSLSRVDVATFSPYNGQSLTDNANHFSWTGVPLR